MKKIRDRTKVKFLLAGLLMAALNIALFATMEKLFGDTLPYLTIYLAVYACVLVVGFNIYRRAVFGSTKKYLNSIVEYFFASQVNFWAGGFSLWFLVEIFGLGATESQLWFILISAPIMFIVSKNRIFN